MLPEEHFKELCSSSCNLQHDVVDMERISTMGHPESIFSVSTLFCAVCLDVLSRMHHLTELRPHLL
eukprot:scaffold15238_cov125-Skeletonema_dohrnii-CCMP3373.AAC.3